MVQVDEIRGSVHKVRIGVGKIRHFQLMFGASMNAVLKSYFLI